jgi:hypothetical protein
VTHTHVFDADPNLRSRFKLVIWVLFNGEAVKTPEGPLQYSSNAVDLLEQVLSADIVERRVIVTTMFVQDFEHKIRFCE